MFFGKDLKFSGHETKKKIMPIVYKFSGQAVPKVGMSLFFVSGGVSLVGVYLPSYRPRVLPGTSRQGPKVLITPSGSGGSPTEGYVG